MNMCANRIELKYTLVIYRNLLYWLLKPTVEMGR